MKIELTYDPVGPELAVKIDDQMTDSTDIFGFLYPVRNCILQTWLEPSGSWPGLVRQLRELSRGEELRLLFRGRRCEYEDLLKAVGAMEDVSVSFEQWECIAAHRQQMQDIRQALAQLLDTPAADLERKKLSLGEGTGGIAYYFPEEAGQIGSILTAVHPDWYSRISSDKEYREADQRAGQCCVVAGEYLDSYERLEQLTKLTRSLRRSQDMICCCFSDEQTCREYADYAQQYGSMGFRFVTAGASDWEKSLHEKYGAAYELSQQLSVFRNILSVIGMCYAQKAEIDAQRAKLMGTDRKTGLEYTKQKGKWLVQREDTYNEAWKLLRESPAEAVARKEWVNLGK